MFRFMFISTMIKIGTFLLQSLDLMIHCSEFGGPERVPMVFLDEIGDDSSRLSQEFVLALGHVRRCGFDNLGDEEFALPVWTQICGEILIVC